MTAGAYPGGNYWRKQAERQSLYSNLARLRDREASYIEASATVPTLLLNQINDVRQTIQAVEQELALLADESLETPAHQLYWAAFAAELAGDAPKATGLYKRAARYDYPDAEPAVRSLRYQLRIARDEVALEKRGMPVPVDQFRNRFLFGLGIFVLVILAISLAWRGRNRPPASEAPAAMAAATPTVAQLASETPTPAPTMTPTDTATPTATPSPTSTRALPTPTETPGPTSTPAPTPMPAPTLRAAPKLIGPRDNLVWQGGAIIFEFEDLALAYDELYCLDTLRGYDKNQAENWSYPPAGRVSPSIPIEANVFNIAKSQGITCIVWSAGIGQGSCETIISEMTPLRVIGLPNPCNFK